MNAAIIVGGIIARARARETAVGAVLTERGRHAGAIAKALPTTTIRTAGTFRVRVIQTDALPPCVLA